MPPPPNAPPRSAATAFARQRAHRIAADTALLIRQTLPAEAVADEENMAISQRFCLGHFHHHRFASVNGNAVRDQLKGLAQSLALQAHTVHSAALDMLSSRWLKLYPSAAAVVAATRDGAQGSSRQGRRKAERGVQPEGAEAVLALLLALSKRPARAADRDVAARLATGELGALQQRWEDLLGQRVLSGQPLPQWQPFPQGTDAADRSWTQEPAGERLADAKDDEDALSEWSDAEDEDEEQPPAKPSVMPPPPVLATGSRQVLAAAEQQRGVDVAAALAAAAEGEAILKTLVASAYPQMVIEATQESHWQMQLAAEPYRELGLSPLATTLTEVALAREAHFLVHGTPNPCIFIRDSQAGAEARLFTLAPRIYVPGRTRGALQLALSPVFQLAAGLVGIARFVDEVHTREAGMARGTAPPFARFWSALAQVLDEARCALLNSLEERMSGQLPTSHLSFPRLCRAAYGALRLASLLARIVNAAGNLGEDKVGSTIDTVVNALERAHVLPGDQQTEMEKLARHILLRSITPYCDMLDAFTANGAMPALHEGLFIQPLENTQERISPQLRRDVPCPVVFMPAAEQLLEAGHAARLMLLCKGRSAANDNASLKDCIAQAMGHEAAANETRLVVSLPNPPPSDSLESWFEAALQPATPPPPLERGSPNLDDYFDAPPDAVKQTLMNAIGMYSAAQWQASQAPLAVKLLDDMQLLAHIEMVHSVFCMGDGHTMSTFCDDLFSAAARNLPSWNRPVAVTIALQEALEKAGPTAAPLYSFRLRNGDHETVAPTALSGIESLGNLELVYSMPWPCTLVLSADAMRGYNRIFILMTKIKFARWLLNALHRAGQKSQQHGPVMWHSLFLLRARLVHSIQALEDYIMHRVLHSLGEELRAKVSAASTLAEMQAAHRMYMSTALKRCFLTEQTAIMGAALDRLCRAAQDFYKLWQHNVTGKADMLAAPSLGAGEKAVRRSVTTLDFAKIEHEHKRCLQFLISLMQSVAGRGSLAHLEALAQQLSAGVKDTRGLSLPPIFPQQAAGLSAYRV